MNKVRHQVNALNINYFNALRKHLNTLMVKDGIFWKQMAKTLWLKDDDLNTHFLHALATSIKKVNYITIQLARFVLAFLGNLCN